MLIKRLVASILSFLLLLSLFACQTGDKSDETSESVSTSETSDEVLKESPAEDFEYSVIWDQDVYINKYLGNDAHVVIPERIEGVPVAVIAGSAFKDNNTLVSVVLPDTVTSIFEDAFENCSSLETVVLSKNLFQICDSAFLNCTNLSSITLPDTLEKIGNSVFRNCSALTTITLPSTLEKIGDRAFENCVSLKHITIPASILAWEWGNEVFMNSGIETVDFEEGVNFVGSKAFWGTKIKSLTMPKSMSSIGNFAFCYCENLESITLNDGLLAIGANAFGYTKITEIVIPQTVIDMMGAFSGCQNLKKIMFEGNAPEDIFPLSPSPLSCTIYYHEGAEGFASPEWNGYPTANW